MLKPIKVTEQSAQAIEAALLATNGRATAHTYTTFGEVAELARRAEAKLERLGIIKAARVGAKFSSTSGDSVAKSYNGTRIATIVELERRSTGWFVVGLAQTSLWTEGGREHLTLTVGQDDLAVAKLRQEYRVAKVTA